MVMRSINNTFNRGELDPSLNARDDLELYAKGARKLRNMVSLWTGAATISAGTIYTDIVLDRETSNTPITNPEHVKAFDFLFSSDLNITYTLVLRASGSSSALDIYYNNVRQTTVTTPPYTPAQIKNVHVVEGQDRILFLHENVHTYTLRRTGSHSSWSFTTISLTANPTFDYSQLNKATNYSSFTFTLGAVSGSTSLTSSSAVFTANHVGGVLYHFGGVGRISAVASSTSASISIVEDFPSTSFLGANAILKEKMWTSGGGSPAGANRGWPARGTFFLGRLILGRSLQLKNIAALSTNGVYDNFDETIVDDLVSFTASFNGRGEQSIQTIVADDSIMFLSTNKIFAQSPLVETLLTASNAYFAPQTESPAADIEAVSIDNQSIYISGNRTEVMQAIYDTQVAKYIGSPASMLSGHLFEKLNSNSTWEPEGIPTRLYLATQDNGTMLMYSTLSQQNVAGWSLRTTRGKFLQTIGHSRQAHVLVKRQVTIGPTTFETFLDHAFLSNPAMTAFNDVTSEFASGASANGVLENLDDYIVLGNDIPYTAIDITLNLAGSSDAGLELEYLDGNGFWNLFTPTDNTSGLTSSGSVTWTFNDVLNWQPNTVNGIENTYWIRIRRTTESITTTPVLTTIKVNTGERIYLERQSFDKYTDATITRTSSSTGLVTGLTHLRGHQVYAIQDGATTGPYFVNASGQATIKPVNATVDIGIQYTPLLVPMPLYVPTNEGDNMYSQKYVQDLFIDYVDSLYLKAGIGDTISDIPNMNLGNYTLGQSVPPQSGIYRMAPRGDWQPRQEIKITQSQPGPMTIIGVGYHVEVT